MKKFFSKFKGSGKTLSAALAVACITALGAVSVGAVDTAQDAFSSALSNIQGDIMGYILLIIPVGLAIFGTIIAIKKGMAFVKTLIGR